MYRAPFHRQILPWLFAAVFFALAPVLIFYTAGYRYNPKKGQIERNGTLIADSLPKGARIFLDGSDTGEVTPFTFQNVTAGLHAIRMEKEQTHAWEKSLDIRPEHVTFADRVRLWQKTMPEIALQRTFLQVKADPSREKSALIFAQASSVNVAIWSPDENVTETKTIPSASAEHPPILRFREDGKSLLAGGMALDDRAWWTQIASRDEAFQTLPPGSYHWTDGNIAGTDGAHRFTLNLRTGSLTRERLPVGVLDRDNGFSVNRSTSTGAWTLMEQPKLERSFELPDGEWRFAGTKPPFLLLKDRDRWLALNPRTKPPAAWIVTGDRPEWLAESDVPAALFLHRNELWLWRNQERPALLQRQSEPFVKAAWHHSGDAAFVATRQRLFVLDLDERNGRLVTDLAAFDEIRDFDLIEKTLYIAAKKDGIDALWKLKVE